MKLFFYSIDWVEHNWFKYLSYITDVRVYHSAYHMKSSDAKASKCHLKFSSLMMIFSNLYI